MINFKNLRVEFDHEDDDEREVYITSILLNLSAAQHASIILHMSGHFYLDAEAARHI
jgi:hypothetical protein